MRVVAALLCVGLSTGTAFAASGDPQRRHTPVDQARARAALVRASDLPGWRASRPARPNASNRCRSFSPDLSGLVETGSAASPEFSRGRLRISSHVALVATASQGLAAWKALARRDMLACVDEAFRAAGIRVERISNRVLRFPRVAPRVVAFRSSFVLSGFGDPKPARGSADIILLGRGRALAALGASCDGGVFPASLERRLARLVAQRLPR
jgi:hypothetical protein